MAVSTAQKLTEVVPPSLDSLLGQISTKLDQEEARDVIHELKRLYPTKADSFDQTDLYGALKQLYVQGVIDDGGDQKMLEILAGKTSKNEEIMKLLGGYKDASLSRKDGFVGRDDDVNNLIELVMDPRVPAVNVFGESGVGKTTLAIEVSKKLAKNENYVPFIVDLRGTKDINTVYFKVLETFQLTPWDYSKERIYTHLKHHLETKTLIILDNIEQFLSYENEADKKRRNEFLSFLRTIMSSEASQRGSLKVILTSRKKIDDLMLEDTCFQEKELKPLTNKDSRQLMSGRIRDETADDEQDKALVEIADLCRNTPYLLERAEQLLRQNFSKPSDVLGKLNTIKNKGVQERFACISALFDSLPSDDLRRVAVQISLFQRSFSVSTAMKIAEISLQHDAELGLEMLATQKIITAENVNGERKYDLHALFREFVTSYLCKDPVYKDVYKKAENQFAEHFSKRFVQLAGNLDKDFVGTYKELQEDKANLELSIDLITRKETLDLIFQSADDVKETGSVAILFEAFKSMKERRKLFGEWAKIVEKKGNWLASANFRCWESIQFADMEGTQTACEALKKAEMSLAKAMLIRTPQEVSAVKGFCKYCSGRIKCMSSANLIDESRKLEREQLLEQALLDSKNSLAIHEEVYGDHTLTARTLNIIGNCYMECDKPKEALDFYQQAMDMKIKLVGSEKHFDIPTYYNQLSQVYEALGKEETFSETSWSFVSIAKRIWSLISQEKRQNYNKAVEYLEKALTLQKEMGVNDTADTATFQRNLANILLGLGEYDKALEYAQKSFKIRNDNLGEHPETVRILYLIGVIHEWRKDRKAALQSYEEAFAMEESLPEDNHSIVRKLLCDRLEEMCKKLNKKDKLKEYKPRIKAIMQIQSPLSGTQEPVRQVLPKTEGRDTHPETAEEPTEEDFHDQPVQGDIPEETPLSVTEPGVGVTESPVQEDVPDDTPVAPGTVGIEPVQGDLPDDTPVIPGTADTEPVQEDVGVPAVVEIVDEITQQINTIYPEGGTLDIPIIGIRLDIPPNAVSQATTVICRKYTAHSLPVPPPAGKGETIVSYIVGLEPSTAELNKRILVDLMHSGPGKGYGYETVVKAFDQESETWQEPKVRDRRQVKESAHCRKDYVGVQISKLTILAVVTRLITDRFQVTPKGCVVRSSVCDDVTIEFPEGAVDKTVEGTMKLLPMPKDIYKVFNVYAAPMLSVKGFENVEFFTFVTIQVPRPSPTGYSTDQTKLVQLKNDVWQEMENIKFDVEDTHIKFHIRHFCWLWLVVPVGGTVAAAAAYKMYKSLKSSLQVAFIAALKERQIPDPQMTLHCLANHRHEEFLEKKKKDHAKLGASTVDGLRPGEEAKIKIEGSQFETTDEEIKLKFLANETSMRQVNLRKKQQNTGKKELCLTFYKENYEDPPFLTFKIEENRIAPNGDGSAESPIFNLSDAQTRWLVIGICLNKTLLLPLRDVLKQEMYKHYNDLKTKYNIHNQSHKKQLKKDGRQALIYKSINNNKAKKKKTNLYDYNVKSPEDLGKLYLMPYMAKFTGFDDTCDLSAVLGILSSASVFSPVVQKLAKEVKNNIRNPWGHCKVQEWTNKKFTSCFDLMKRLVQALNLPAEDEKQTIDELGEWETKRIDAGYSAKFFEFAQTEIKRLSQEVNRLQEIQKEESEEIADSLHRLEARQEEEAEKTSDTLHLLAASQEEAAEQIGDTLHRLEATQEEDQKITSTLQGILETLVQNNKCQEKKLEAIEKRVTHLERNQDVFEQKQETDEKRIEIVEKKLQDMTSITDKEPVECFGILVTDPDFKDLPEDIIPLMMPHLQGDEIPGKESGQWKPEDFLRNFTKNADKSRTASLRQHLLNVLQTKPTDYSLTPDFTVSMSHVIELLRFGKQLVTTPLGTNQELKERTIEILSENLSSKNLDYCWETLADHLEVSEDIVNRCKEGSGDTRQMLGQWIETSDKSCTLEDIFHALRLCGYKDTGMKLATYTTRECRQKLGR